MDISVLGIDTSKTVFELCGLNRLGRVVYKRRVRRAYFLNELSKLPMTRVVLEASGGSRSTSGFPFNVLR